MDDGDKVCELIEKRNPDRAYKEDEKFRLQYLYSNELITISIPENELYV